MDFEVENRTLLTFWGFSVLVGWVVSYYLNSFFQPVSMIAFWTILMSIPIIAAIKWMGQQSSDTLPLPWVLTTGLALVLGFAVVEGHIHVPEIESYAVFWFFLPALAFSATTYYTKGFLTHLYTSASLANFMVAALLLFQPNVMQQHYILAAVFQAFPLLYHAYYEF